MTRPSFVIELAADARFAKDLAAGGVFVPARGFKVMDELDLVVQGAGGELCLPARVVYVDPEQGCGLELVGFGAEIKEQLAQLAATPAEIAAVAQAAAHKRARVLTTRPGLARSPQAHDIAMIELEDELDDAIGIVAGVPTDVEIVEDEPAPAPCEVPDAEAYAAAAAELDDDDTLGARSDEEQPETDLAAYLAEHDPDAERETEGRRGRIPLNAPERLRGLNLAQQIKVARGPSAGERMALERMYGRNVWEALLHNPGLTVPEVARLARLGNLPRVLLELVVNNNTWLQVPEIRRALLANPRLGTDQAMRVLRLLPKHELKLAATIPAYPHAVRSIAKKMIEQD